VARIERPRWAFGILIFTDFADRGPLGANKRLNISPPINHPRDANPSRWARAVKRSDRVLSLARVQVNLDEREGKEREREREREREDPIRGRISGFASLDHSDGVSRAP